MPQPRYRAFLSYSHRDKDIGEAIHRALETYTVPRDLVGKKADHGEIPAKLRPVFRDRYDLEAGHSLHHQVSEALRASEALIVLCSPASAKSKYVGGEIRAFKALGRTDRIYPVIIGGEPGDPERECFNPALRFKVDADGQLTSEPEEPLAADWRAEGDGPDLAKLKLIAGLIGVDLDHLRRREAEEQKRQKRRWMAVAASMAGLAVLASIASFLAWRESERNARMLERTITTTQNLITTAVDAGGEFGVPTRVSMRFLDAADRIFTDMDELNVHSEKLDLRRAELQMTFAESYAKLGRVGDQMKAARKALDAARLLAARDPAERVYQEALARAHLRMGRAYAIRRELARAMSAYNDALAVHAKHFGGRGATTKEALELGSDIYQEIALTHFRRDEYLAATEAAEAAVMLTERLMKVAGNESGASRFVSVVTKLADFWRARQKPQDALVLTRNAMAVASAELQRNPNGVDQQRHVAALLLVHGDVQRALDDKEQALRTYKSAFEIRKRLHEQDPQNRLLSEDAAFALVKIGEMQLALGQGEAEASFAAARLVLEEILVANEDNVSAASQLIHALDGQAEFLRSRRKHTEANATNARKIEVSTRILAQDPENREAQRNLSKAYLAFGTNLLEQGDPAAAYENFDRSIAIRRPMLDATLNELLPSQITNDERGLAEALEKAGDAELRRLRPAPALVHYQEALEFRRKHRALLPDDATIAQRLAASLERAADAFGEMGDAQRSLALLSEAKPLRAGAFAKPEDRRLLALLHERIGRMHHRAGDARAARAAYAESLPLRRGLHEAARNLPDKTALAQPARNLAETYRLIASAEAALGDCAAARLSFAAAEVHIVEALALKPDNTAWQALKQQIAAAVSDGAGLCPAGAATSSTPPRAAPAEMPVPVSDGER